ncbi:DsbA family protein [Noviherbaspirillum sp.]|uniref:DsbA family protein n=1 Tax=Noviherbaspirillum sp. TaxID=1926288 RepID=UPI002D3444FC|nr:thioredoxin domain-containing protein [Noviherbaspirillum sp.]HZW22697.1 thioredoxin domain-containing protein [Noviherbaspirillum sp.]
MSQLQFIVRTMLVLLIAFTGADYLAQNVPARVEADGWARKRDALVRFYTPSVGRADAPVHIVIFMDPASEICRVFYPLVREMREADPDRIRLTVRSAVVVGDMDKVLEILEAARRQGKFWEVLEGLLHAQPVWVKKDEIRPDAAWKVVENLDIGLDMPRARADAASRDVFLTIRRDKGDTARMVVKEPAVFFVNGKRLPRPGVESLKKLVAESMDKAVSG